MTEQKEWITLTECKEHNLKNISLQIPLGSLTLLCGVSGSGKSTLAHDVCFAEGQGRFLESFSAYARIFQARLNRSHTRRIDNIPPALALEQVFLNHNPRSTVATLSDLYSPIRLLYSRFAQISAANKPTRSHLSFNHPLGACPDCQGLGQVYTLDHESLIRDGRLSLRQGALRLSTPNGYIIYSQVTIDVLDQVCRAHGFSVDIAWQDLRDEQKQVVLYGSDRIEIPFGKHPLESRLKWSGITAKPRELGHYRGIVPIMEEILKRDPNPNILRWCRQQPCPNCQGLRLRRQMHGLRYRQTDLGTLLAFTVSELADWSFGELKLGKLQEPEKRLLDELNRHSRLLVDLRLGHLQLLRSIPSLSPAEIQGIRLASLLKSPISDMLYVLDEPASALHPFEKPPVYRHIRNLLAQNCTILLVSHDRAALDYADWVVEMGPGGGAQGGNVLFSGKADDFRNRIAHDPTLTPTMTAWSKPMTQAPQQRIQSQQAVAECGLITVVSGLSGSGKSSLLGKLTQSHERLDERERDFDRVQFVDQQPLGKNSRSNPATYTGLFDDIRTLFARQTQAREQGLSSSAFSFNSQAGACPSCQGSGMIEISLHHLSPISQICEGCQGRRYQPEVLGIQYEGLAIDEVLSLTVSQALAFFHKEKKISARLKVLADLGLGYLTIGQPSSSLSGGEAQRVRLASFIAPGQRNRTLYLLDEPCLGLHDQDIPCLLYALKKLAGQGAALVIAENNPLFVSGCDRLLELVNRKPDPSSTEISAGRDADPDKIVMHGVRTRNLQNLSLVIPKRKLTVVCGPSGSGKSSLLHETLYKTCQRRYAEHLSPYLRDRLALGGHGDVDEINPYMPALSLVSHHGGGNPRSTVGTLSGINDTLRVLFSRLGQPEPNAVNKTLRAADFSFNHPDGACSFCTGLGTVTQADASRWLVNPQLGILNGAFSADKGCQFFFAADGRRIAELLGAARALNIDVIAPWCALSSQAKDLILNGHEGDFPVVWNYSRGKRSGEHRYQAPWPGFNRLILEAWRQKKEHKKQAINFQQVVFTGDCPVCHGLRLKNTTLEVRLGRVSLRDVLSAFLTDLHKQFRTFSSALFADNPSRNELAVCTELMPDLQLQLEQILALGLGYLNLSRAADSLSYGEMQRLRLAAFLGNRLNHCLFILDEISRGLHPLDIASLSGVIGQLLARRNTVALIDHHPLVQREADWLIELGPGGGKRGGQICRMGQGNRTDFSPDPLRIAAMPSAGAIIVRQAKVNNLDGIDIEIPASGITVLCGVSGSGKTTLMREVIGRSFTAASPVHCQEINGLDRFSAVHFFDNRMGSNGPGESLLDFLSMREPIMRLFGKPVLSACPHCQGEGEMRTDLDYMGSYASECPFCLQTGYETATLAAKVGTVSLADTLSCEIGEMSASIVTAAGLQRELALAKEFSLDYLSLNRKLGSLSVGERQRLTIARILLGLGEQASLLLLDEPDSGLSANECRQLLECLRRHVGDRHAALVVSHHPVFMAGADWLIDLGPGAGPQGGKLTAQGSPEQIVSGNWPLSYTAKFLKTLYPRKTTLG